MESSSSSSHREWKKLEGNIDKSAAWEIKGLVAKGPYHELEKPLMLFGQFVGDWDILENRYYLHDKTEVEHEGEIHFGWILDGRAIQDVWMWKDEKTGKLISGGTTIRFYDPKIEVWHSIWICPLQGSPREFVGRKVGDEIVLEGKSNEGKRAKWIFYEIKADSFRWRAEESKDGGKTWTLAEEILIQRRNPNEC